MKKTTFCALTGFVLSSWSVGCGDSGSNQSAGDASPDATGTIAIDGGPGSKLDRSCPAPCQGDPVAGFGMTQGGVTGRWLYMADSRVGNGATYVDMVAGTYDGEMGWVGASGGPPAIVQCTTKSTSNVCTGAGDSLVFVPSSSVASDSDPTLAYVVPYDAAYRLAGTFKAPSDPSAPQKFLLSRNAKHDLLHRENFAAVATSTDFSVDFEALRGDRILLTLLPNDDGSAAAVAFDFYVSLLASGEDGFPGRCQLAVDFDDDSDAFADRCGDVPWRNIDYAGNDPAVLSVEGVSVNSVFGNSRVLDQDQYLASAGSPMDYSGDFTVQLWIKQTIPAPTTFGSVAFSDQYDRNRGGFWWYHIGTSDRAAACYRWAETDTSLGCFEDVNHVGIDGDWHFYRIARIGDTLEACIDGKIIGTTTQTAGFDMTSNRSPRIGRHQSGPAYFGGAVDDIRIYSRGLPCN